MKEQDHRIYFNISQFVEDNGGAAKVARITGKNRTTPYKWIARGFITTRIMESIKRANPTINFNKYFQ